MSKRNTETLYLRVEPEVAHLVRHECENRHLPLSQFAELAFRQSIADTTGEADRRNLLSGVEEALIKRLEERTTGLLNRVGDLYVQGGL